MTSRKARLNRNSLLTLLTLSMVPAILGISGLRAKPTNTVTRLGGDGTFYGAPQSLGSGTVRTYVEVRGGEPVEVGVAMSEGALQNLPAAHPGHADPHASMVAYLLDLPAHRVRTRSRRRGALGRRRDHFRQPCGTI